MAYPLVSCCLSESSDENNSGHSYSNSYVRSEEQMTARSMDLSVDEIGQTSRDSSSMETYDNDQKLAHSASPLSVTAERHDLFS